MSNVAIIGTQGAGKTVFITILAHQLMRNGATGISLDAHQNSKTQKYIEKNWHRLQHREWPVHTPAGQSPDLQWDLKIKGDAIGHLRVVDASGHDIRLIFSDDKVTSPEMLPDPLKLIADYCRNSDVAVFVANLTDYIERPGSTDHIENEAVLKSALDYVGTNGRKGCVVFTQADLYKDYVDCLPGRSDTERWLSAAQLHLGTIHSAHLCRGTPIFPLACVAQTEVTVDNDDAQRVPKPGFTSEGLDPFLDWLTQSVTPPPPPPPAAQPWPAIIAGGVAFLAFLITCTKTVPHWLGPDTSEFNPVSLGIALFVFFVVWGVLALIQTIVRGFKRS